MAQRLTAAHVVAVPAGTALHMALGLRPMALLPRYRVGLSSQGQFPQGHGGSAHCGDMEATRLDVPIRPNTGALLFPVMCTRRPVPLDAPARAHAGNAKGPTWLMD